MIRRWAQQSFGRSPVVAASMRSFAGSSFASADLPLSISSMAMAPTINRSFSSKSTILEILGREEREEVDTGNTQMPTDMSDLRTTIEESWKIVESGASTDLFKIDNPSNNKIRVSFHCQDTLEVDSGYDESGYDEDGEEDDDDEEVSAPVRFTVTITKAGESLNFACFSEVGEVKIEGVSTTASSTAEYVHQNQGTLPKIEYQGPDFTELAEDLQDAIAVYLDEECGVNSDVAAFIAMSADFREEINYVDFLKQAQSIIS
jgi:complement component 1 Q subcomponent-binding protein